MTMQDRLIELLKSEWLTPLEALHKAGCMSLSQRAGDLGRMGMSIEKRWVDLPNGKRVMSYRIVERTE